MVLRVNGRRYEVDAPPDRALLYVLRDDLALTGTKYGCGEGQCGACTVLLDGVPVRSCQLPCGAVGPQKVTTVEGLERGDRPGPNGVEGLHPLQVALLEVGA